MITLYDIFIISIVGVLMFSGVGAINEYMYLKGNLGEDSQNLVLEYDDTLATFISTYNASYQSAYNNGTVVGEIETDVNTLDAFIKEYGEAKAKVNILRRGTDMITDIPDLLFLSIPFVDEGDVAFYKEVLFYILIVLIVMGLFVALFQKVVA